MRRLITGKWLLAHALVVGVVLVFLWLGRWQLGRGEAGNIRSYAYALEWPTFALLVVGFWVKVLRDELHPKVDTDAGGAAEVAPSDRPTVRTGPTAIPARRSSRWRDRIDEDAAELAAYNRYVADLARQRGRQ